MLKPDKFVDCRVLALHTVVDKFTSKMKRKNVNPCNLIYPDLMFDWKDKNKTVKTYMSNISDDLDRIGISCNEFKIYKSEQEKFYDLCQGNICLIYHSYGALLKNFGRISQMLPVNLGHYFCIKRLKEKRGDIVISAYDHAFRTMKFHDLFENDSQPIRLIVPRQKNDIFSFDRSIDGIKYELTKQAITDISNLLRELTSNNLVEKERVVAWIRCIYRLSITRYWYSKSFNCHESFRKDFEKIAISHYDVATKIQDYVFRKRHDILLESQIDRLEHALNNELCFRFRQLECKL